jgi:hypothetical protein
MKCGFCGFCGFTKLHLQGTHFSVVPSTFGIVTSVTPYGCSNIIMSTYTTTSDGLHVYVCNACFKFYEQPERINMKEQMSYICWARKDNIMWILFNYQMTCYKRTSL